MLPTMFSFRGHVTSGTLTLQRFLSSTKSIIERKSANVNLRPFRKQLELIYEEDHYPSLERREIVAQDLGVPIKSLSRWFIYRRTTDKNTRSLHGQDTSIFRHRELCTNEQKKILRDQCARNLYPNDSEIVLLAERLGMDKKRIGTKLLVNLRSRVRRGLVSGNVVMPLAPPRLRMSNDELAILEDHFQRDPYPKQTGAFDALVQKLGLSPLKVENWFNDRRRREREHPIRPLTKVMDDLQKRKRYCTVLAVP